MDLVPAVYSECSNYVMLGICSLLHAGSERYRHWRLSSSTAAASCLHFISRLTFATTATDNAHWSMIRTRCHRAWTWHRRSLLSIRTITTLNHDLARPVQSYISTSNNPYLNLSIEHHLLQKSSPDSTILLLYTNRPCVVIGRNQNPWTEVNIPLLRSASHLQSPVSTPGAAIDLVRRRSGGGTVFHDSGNVNWTVICPATSFTRDKHAEMVVRALRRLGVAHSRVNERHDIVLDPKTSAFASAPPETRASWTAADEDTHRTPWTDAAGGEKPRKVSGSAYKLTRGRALHHGTALCESPNLPLLGRLLRAPGRAHIVDSRGVESVSSPVANIGITTGQFMDAVRGEFGRMYHHGGEMQAQGVGEAWRGVEDVAAGIAELEGDEWRFLQTPRFGVSGADAEEELEGVEFEMLTKGGRVESIEVGESWLKANGVAERVVGRALHEIKDWEEVLGGDGDEPWTQRTGAWLTRVLPTMADK